MKANVLYRALSISILAAVALSAQARHEIQLKNWSAPLYWQPAAVEVEAAKTEVASRTLAPEVQPAPPQTATSLVFVAMTPCRVVDTRASQMFPAGFGGPSLMPGPSRSFAIQLSNLCSIPATAQAYSFNVTLVPPGPVGYLKLWPTGAAEPNAVTLDDITGDIRNNAAIVPAGTPNGSVSAVVNNNTDMVIDINGYYAPPVMVAVPQGTAAAPSISFAGDPGTGIFSSGAGLLNLTAGGSTGLTLDSTGDVNIAHGLQLGSSLNLILPPFVTGEFIGSAPTPAFATGDPLAMCASSRKTWMTHGMFLCFGSDLMYVGQKGLSGGQVINDQNDDRKDSVIAWGDNPEADAGIGVGPDALRFIFTGRKSLMPLQSGLEDGLEVARFMPSGNFGIGTTAPSAPLDVNGQARIRVLTGTGNSLVTADASGGTQGLLHSLAFPTVNPTTTFLRGDGTFAMPPSGSTIGPCSLGANYLTKWTSTTTIDCSHITELAASPYKVGIGPSETSPSRQLEVNGDINIFTTLTEHYQIGGSTVLSVDGNTNLFVGLNAGTANVSTGPFNSQGHDNTFLGQNNGAANTSGGLNTFVGASAGGKNTTGASNTFAGWDAGGVEVDGQYNAYLGFQSGINHVHGQSNTFLGANAGYYNISGDNDIYVGSTGCGTTGCAESSTIRIGGGQSAAYVSGIFSASVSAATGIPVNVDSSGKLGTTLSSRRFKENIVDMGETSSRLSQLRPVNFFYKPQFDDGSHQLQYGLIAEEVAQVYPDMVVYDKEGTPLTVKYQLLAPMLLNELQKQQALTQDLQQRLQRLEALIAKQ